MASLLDYLLGQGTPLQTDAQGQVTGPVGQPQGGLLGGLSNYLGNNSDRLMSMGMGFLSGANQQEGFANAMQGMQRGATLDRQRALLQQAQADKLAKQQAARKAAGILKIDPSIVEASPDVIGTVAGAKYAPKEKSFEERLYMTLTPEQQAAFRASKFLPQAEKPTDDIREYQFAMQQNAAQGKPQQGFTEWLIEKRRAGATNVNVGGTEKNYDQTVGKGYGERFMELQNGANAARTKLATFDAMDALMQTPGFRSGQGADFETAVRRGAIALGADGEKLKGGTAAMEAFRGLSSKATVDGLGSLGTGVSNADRDFIQQTNPSLGTTPDGNRMQMKILSKMERRRIELAGLARQYAAKNNGRIDAGFDDVAEKWAESNPLFSPQEKAEIAGATAKKGGASQGRTSRGISWGVSP